MSGVISRWFGGVKMLPYIAERLLRVQIENRPAEDVIRLYALRRRYSIATHLTSMRRGATRKRTGTK